MFRNPIVVLLLISVVLLSVFSATTAAQDVRDIEDLERPDDADEEGEQEGWRQEWQCDAAKCLPGAGAIDPGGLVEVWRDVLEASEVDDRAAPDTP